MIVDTTYVEAALHMLGAHRIDEIYGDPSDTTRVTALEVSPDVSLAGYAAALAIVERGPVPQSISDRQFFQQLAIEGIISEAEALASNAAVIPQPLLDIIDAMPAENQFAAKMLVSGATVFERHHEMTIVIGAARGMTSEQVDDFFRAAARL